MSYVLIVGAFERDNFGDILFGRIAERVLSDHTCVKASLISADMRAYGGGIVVCIDDIMADKGLLPAAVVCLGGETLAAGLADAYGYDLDLDLAVTFGHMQSADRAERLLRLADAPRPFAYLMQAQDFGLAAGSIPFGYLSVGGIGLQFVDSAIVAASAQRTRAADFLTVRDAATQAAVLANQGGSPGFAADAAFSTPALFPDEIAQARKRLHETAKVRPEAALVFQCNRDILNMFGIDATAHKMVELCRELGLDLVVQPMGLAHMHDHLPQLKQLLTACESADPSLKTWLQPERDIWTQCAVLSAAHLWVGTSLHGRVLATAFGRPALSLPNIKVEYNVASWHESKDSAGVALDALADAARAALGRSQDERDAVAARLSADALQSLEALRAWVSGLVGGTPKAALCQQVQLGALLSESKRLRRLALTPLAPQF